ncbi:hypothetical protein BN2476_850035 [Paraburkholderia piptadeniae]|uniref:Uncharacterized protein n=1 Tax=Paraburkholderia piptadeniae TaxID=1701573 RepID=A0A1N7STC3_9BURK|nr:hypothetical protein BN2476_850035 [Paraburkholderia piptadeniae]
MLKSGGINQASQPVFLSLALLTFPYTALAILGLDTHRLTSARIPCRTSP